MKHEEMAWVYSKEGVSRLVRKKDARKYYNEGWANSPAKFGKQKYPVLDESILKKENDEGFKKEPNFFGSFDDIDFSDMKKDDLLEYAFTHYNLDLPDSMKKTDIVGKIMLAQKKREEEE